MLIDEGRDWEAVNLIAGLHGWCGTGRTREDDERADKIRAEYDRNGLRAAVALGNQLLEELYEEDEDAEERVRQEHGVSRMEDELWNG